MTVTKDKPKTRPRSPARPTAKTRPAATRSRGIQPPRVNLKRPKSITIAGERFTWRADLADRAIRFLELFCRHFRGDRLAGKSLRLEKWQKWIVGELFGWIREDGTRRYREAYISMARKNGKTFLIAGIGLYLEIADAEPGAEVYAGAADREQARILFETAQKFVEMDANLSKWLTVYRNAITYPKAAAAFKVISADADTKHGLNASGILLDELHAHPNGDLYDVLTTSVGQRRQPLTLIITTAGLFDPTHVCWKRYQYAKRVAANPEVDPYFLPVIYETDPNDDWHDPHVWAKANPGLAGGDLVKLSYLEAEHRKACEDPSLENRFRWLHLNQWTQQITRYLPMDKWAACRVASPPDGLLPAVAATPPAAGESVADDPLAGRPCVLGVDLSLSEDLSSVVELYPFNIAQAGAPAATRSDRGDRGPPSDEQADWGVYVRSHFWLPGENLAARERADHADYGLWARQGRLHLCDGPTILQGPIEAKIRDICSRRKVLAICFDPFAAQGMATTLEAEKFPVVWVPQRPTAIAPATKTLKRLVLAGLLQHDGDPVLAYCANNVAAKMDHVGNEFIVKSKSRGRIDGIAAIVTGLSHLMLDPLPKPKRSRYDTHGVTLL